PLKDWILFGGIVFPLRRIVILRCSMACEGISEKENRRGWLKKTKKNPQPCGGGLKSNSLRRKFEETGVTLMLSTNSDYFISQISVIRFTYILSCGSCSGNQLGLSASGLILS